MYGYEANFGDVTELDARDAAALTAMDEHSPGLPSDPNNPGAPLSAQPAVTAGWGSAADALWRVAGSSSDDVVQLVAVLDALVADFHAAPAEDHVCTEILSLLAWARSAIGTATKPHLGKAVMAVAKHGASSDLDSLLAVLDRTDLASTGRFGTDLLAAGRRRLAGADEAAHRRAGSRLAAVFTDERLPVDLRAAAMHPFWDSEHHTALDQSGAVVAVLGHDDIELSATAAHGLAMFEVHLPLVRRVAAAWPDEVPWRAQLVRERLAGR